MDQLVNMVAQKVNIPPDKAREAVDTVIGFLKDKLPDPIAGHIDGLLHGGGGGSGDMLGGAMQGLGDMFGKKE
jgi:hypothetical protein